MSRLSFIGAFTAAAFMVLGSRGSDAQQATTITTNTPPDIAARTCAPRLPEDGSILASQILFVKQTGKLPDGCTPAFGPAMHENDVQTNNKACASGALPVRQLAPTMLADSSMKGSVPGSIFGARSLIKCTRAMALD